MCGLCKCIVCVCARVRACVCVHTHIWVCVCVCMHVCETMPNCYHEFHYGLVKSKLVRVEGRWWRLPCIYQCKMIS